MTASSTGRPGRKSGRARGVRRPPSSIGPAALGALAALVLPVGAAGQATGLPGSPLSGGPPEWAARWSPLERIDLARTLPSAPRFPSLLSFPEPRVGLSWTAGNPAAFASELEDERAEFRLGLNAASGDYFRPLDPGALRSGQLSTLGWRRLGDRGAVIGGAVFDRTTYGDSAFADVLVPYGSNPLVVLDTIGDPTRRTAIRIEGATGWRFGRLGLGLALGWEGQSRRTIESPVPRLDRTATPGAVLGATFELADGVRLGVHARRRETAEFIQITTISQASRVFQLEGYEEPIPLDLQPDQYQRRFERTENALGAGLAFRLLGGTWAMYGQRETADEDQFTRTNERDPPTDRWEADGWTFGGGAQWSGGAGRWLLTLGGRYTTLDGEASRADLGAVVFTVDESRLRTSADLGLRLGDVWRLGARAEVGRDAHDRQDLLAQATSDIDSWRAGGAIEMARRLGERFAFSIGGRLASYGPAGTIPDPDARGPEYRRYVGPGLALELTEALAGAGTATLRWQAGTSTGLWLQGELGTLDPREETAPLLPSGGRRGWRVIAGAALDELWHW